MAISNCKTASELLMEVLEDFSKCEGRNVLIVYTQEDGTVGVKTNASSTHTAGLAEYAKSCAMRELFAHEEE